jgi:hypothetical protein
MPEDPSFICLHCGRHDFERYCGSCGYPLKADLASFPLLLARKMIDRGYLNAADLPHPPEALELHRRVQIIRLVAKIKLLSAGYHSTLISDLTSFTSLELHFISLADGMTPDIITTKIDQTTTSLKEELNFHRLDLPYKTYHLQYYLLHSNPDQLSKSMPTQASFKSTHFHLSPHCYHLDLRTSKVYPKHAFLLEPDRKKLFKESFEQLHLDDTLRKADERKKKHSFFRAIYETQLIETVLAELKKFALLFLLVIKKPGYYGTLIADGKVSFKESLSQLGLIIGISESIRACFPGQQQHHFSENPVIDRFLVFGLLLGIYLLGTIFIFRSLKAVGGKGSFLKTMMIGIAVSIPFTPVSDLGDILNEKLKLLSADVYNYISSSIFWVLQGLLGIPMLSIVHGISRSKVIKAVIISLISFLAVIVLLALILVKILTPESE